MDQQVTDTLHKMGDHAHARALDIHVEAQQVRAQLVDCQDTSQIYTILSKYHNLMNDFWYWSGKATAYKGIAAGYELRGVVERELDEEGSCP